METFSQKVINQFFQGFYDKRVEIMYNLGKDHKGSLDLSMLLFWFSVIDFYGGIFYVGHNNTILKNRDGSFKLTNYKTFERFIYDFFPKPEKEYGKFIYKIFRSGVVHQLSPKKGGIVWDEDECRLVWTLPEGDYENKIAMLNVYKFQVLTYQSYNCYKEKILTGSLDKHCENIYNNLLKEPDGLEDERVFNEQYKILIEKGILI
jgi:hypothetical protein